MPSAVRAAIFLVPVIGGIARADGVLPVRDFLANPIHLADWLRDRDPKVESARARLEAAEAATDQARVLPNPALSVGVGGLTVGTTNPPGLGLRDTTNYQVGVSELFELGKRGPRRDAAVYRAQEAEQLTVGTLGDRLTDATTALGKLAYVVAKRDVIAVNLEAARRLRDNEGNRLHAGDLSPLEFERIELDTDQLELDLARSESEVTSAVAECSATLVAPCPASDLDSAALDGGAPLPQSLPDPGAAIEARPERLASRLETRALGADATLAARRAIPDPTIGLAYLFDNLTIAGNQEQQFIVSLGFPLPLFDRGNHDAAAARANAHAVLAEDEAEIREAGGLVDSLIAQRATLEATLGKLEQEQVPKSTKIVEQTQIAFDRGEVRLADLLLVERAHRDLLAQVLDTRFDLFNVRVQLRQALGLDDDVARAAYEKSHE